MFRMFQRMIYYKAFSRGRCPQRTKCQQYTREVQNLNEISYEELLKKTKEGAVLIDVRTVQEYREGHLQGAILIPYFALAKEIKSKVPDKEKNIIVYCKNGGRSTTAYEILKNLEYKNVFNLKGGIGGI